jgi:hypothetical protein
MLVRAYHYYIAHGTAGAARIRHSLRPLNTGGRENNLQTSGAMRRENAKSYSSLSSSAKAGDPVSQRRHDRSEKPRRTGSPACAGDDALARNDGFGCGASQPCTARPRSMSASTFCTGEPAISQALLDASDGAGHSVCPGLPIKRAGSSADGQDVAFCDATKTIKQAPANGQWHSGRLLCNAAAGIQASGPGGSRSL